MDFTAAFFFFYVLRNRLGLLLKTDFILELLSLYSEKYK